MDAAAQLEAARRAAHADFLAARERDAHGGAAVSAPARAGADGVAHDARQRATGAEEAQRAGVSDGAASAGRGGAARAGVSTHAAEPHSTSQRAAHAPPSPRADGASGSAPVRERSSGAVGMLRGAASLLGRALCVMRDAQRDPSPTPSAPSPPPQPQQQQAAAFAVGDAVTYLSAAHGAEAAVVTAVERFEGAPASYVLRVCADGREVVTEEARLAPPAREQPRAAAQQPRRDTPAAASPPPASPLRAPPPAGDAAEAARAAALRAQEAEDEALARALQAEEDAAAEAAQQAAAAAAAPRGGGVAPPPEMSSGGALISQLLSLMQEAGAFEPPHAPPSPTAAAAAAGGAGGSGGSGGAGGSSAGSSGAGDGTNVRHFVMPGSGVRVTFSNSGSAGAADLAAPLATLLGSLGGVALGGGGGGVRMMPMFGGGMPFGGAFGGGDGMLTYEQLLALQERLGGAVPRGATAEQVAALPTRRFVAGDAPNSAEDNANTCSICLSDFEGGDELRALPCAHAFHTACVDQWLKTSRQCPCCRHEIA
jgi:hypothetical protein